ncbi:MAG: type II toxin-antitoxin system RelE/ParE family toxin [Methanoregula sp.]|nr:type II toxin-antitoxin system RelE/ParE family toxin [Methanoregula sp.]
MTSLLHLQLLRLYRKFSLDLQQRVKEEAARIATDPYSCEELTVPFVGIRSHHFSFGLTQYRIAYRINKTARCIEIVLVKSRENFYQYLRRILR